MFAPLLSQVVIVLTSTGVSNGLSCANGDLGGYFRPGTNQVSICTQTENPEYVKYHELGHFVFFEKMNSKERAAWYKLSGSYREFGAYVSAYARIYPVEDFAETFAYVATDGKIGNPSTWKPDFTARKRKSDFIKAAAKKYSLTKPIW